ncbi:PH domain-containing protein [Streptomonospora nanhaiensis]|uniref:PH domain-containing protein n=1 Tax=Streptomonospora nanhaiensis TaxID=1323731 RepID=UPI001C38CF38|nr:PH domain-containing protein [Streptomonospora nanhaiensis]MBV2362466.1 PH domain-containing protein [Streptomonospora nanhaiensis]
MVDDAAAEVPAPALPVTWRPRNMRIVGYGLAAVIMVTMVLLAVVLPPDWRLVDRLGLVALGLVGVGVMHLLARPRLTATETRVTVVNSIRTHVLEWPEIVDARMPVGEPWPTIDLADGSTLAVMGIQSNDGDLARTNLARFQALLRNRGEAQEPPRPA